MSSSNGAQKEEERNVRVAIRCRPVNKREKGLNRPIVVQCKPNKSEVTLRKKTYTFDHVFGQYTTQKELFKTIIQPVVAEALDGYNCTVFAYGQTGTGKTHTIQGSLDPEDEDAGIIPRAVRYIFDFLQQNFQDYSVRVSFLQLYNEELSDLLVNEPSGKLRLMEDVKRGGVYCQNLQEIPAATASDVFSLLEKGVKNRTTAETILNENSSRSHSIFTIKLHTKETVPGGEDLLKTGTLNLVDLAGSECIGRSGARQARAREAGNINQSLLTLGRVITALVDRHPHVPYRDSKLTRLLQESLGGRAKTTIIATVAPCADCVDETTSTVDYAYRAKSIKNKPEANQRMTKHALLKDYSHEIDSLRDALRCAREKDGIFIQPAKYAEMQERLTGQASQIEELEGELTKNVDELSELKELTQRQAAELEMEKKNLQERTKELEHITAELKRTTKELEVSMQTVDAYQSNEKTLLENAKRGRELFESVTEEKGLLLEKMKRYEKKQDLNKNAVMAYSQKVSTQVSEFTADVKLHQTELTQAFESVKDLTNQTIQHTNSKAIAEFCQGLREWVKTCMDNTMEAGQARSETLKDGIKNVENWNKQTIECNQTLVEKFGGKVAELAQRLHHELQNQSKASVAILKQISAKIQETSNDTETFCLTHRVKLRDYSGLVATILSEMETHAQQVQDSYTRHEVKESERMEAKLSEMKNTMALMLDSFAQEQRKERVEIRTNIFTQLDSMKENSNSGRERTIAADHAQEDGMNVFTAGFMMNCNALNQHIEEMQTVVTDPTKEMIVNELEQERQDQIQHLVSRTAIAEKEMADLKSNLLEKDQFYQEAAEQRVKDDHEQHSTLIQQVEATNESSKDIVRGLMDEIGDGLDKTSRKTDERLFRQTDQLGRYESSSKEYENSLEWEFATGQTPNSKVATKSFPTFAPTCLEINRKRSVDFTSGIQPPKKYSRSSVALQDVTNAVEEQV